MFPVAATITNSRQSVATTSHPIALPSDRAVGDLLLALAFCANSNVTFTGWPTSGTGWTQIASVTANVVASLRYKWAEAGDVDFTLSTSSTRKSTAWVLRITGAHPTTAPAAAQASSSGAPNPPSLNPANWDVEDTLWIAVGQALGSITGWPTNYSLYQRNDNLAHPNAAFAGREIAATSEDPGVFTGGASDNFQATIAIRPAGQTPPYANVTIR